MTFKKKIEQVLYDAIHTAFSSKKIIESIVRLADNQTVKFAEWLDKEETHELILDLQTVGELPKEPTKRQLFLIYKNTKK